MQTQATLSVNSASITDLKPHPENPRKHSKRHIRQVAESIRRFGFRVPILVDGNQRLIAGHARLEACKLLGMAEVPVIAAADLSDAQIRALMIADNKLTENAEWDEQLLGQNFKILSELNLDFDLEITGFEYGDIERLMVLGEDTEIVTEEVETIATPVCKLGDIWQLGDHRILCGDSTDASSYSVLLGEEKAQLVFTDAPYNLPAKTIGKVCQQKHGDFAQAAGEMSPAEFTAFLATVFSHLCAWSVEGSIHYVFMDWRHLSEIISAGNQHYSEFKNLCVWAKDRAGMGTFYRSQHELILVFKNGKATHRNHFKLGQHGRTRSNLWQFPAVRNLGAEEGSKNNDALALHPTIKPVRLIEEALLDCSRRNEIVLDPFLGSGSTLIACEKTKRRCMGIECEPRYVDVALQRWKAMTGEEPIHVQSQQTYSVRATGTDKQGEKS